MLFRVPAGRRSANEHHKKFELLHAAKIKNRPANLNIINLKYFYRSVCQPPPQ